MNYSEMKRKDMQDHLEMEEKFYPLNRRQPSTLIRDLAWIFGVFAICLLGLFVLFTWAR